MNATQDRVIRLLKAHGVRCRPLPNGQVAAVAHWFNKGKAGFSVERVDATVQSAREWLGY